MMMQMLAAGGMPILGDTERRDENNPRGYYEWDGVREITKNPECITAAEGKAVKLVSSFLCLLPATHEYRIILMERPLDEVIASMAKMHRNLHPEDEETPRNIVAPDFRHALEALNREVLHWLDRQPAGTWTRVSYNKIIEDPLSAVVEFGRRQSLPLEVMFRMIMAVDETLYQSPYRPRALPS